MKRLISLASAMILAFTTVFSGTAFAAFSDVDSSNKYAKAISTLSKLNIINGYDDGTFKPEGLITRGEFTKIVTYALGLSELKTEPTEFSDISEHWARYNIKTAYDKKIINGFTDGTFRPDDNVTYEQALKMVVCTLGYGDIAENQGGYPTGYHSQAATLELTDNISDVAFTDAAPRGVIAQMVYNALDVPMKELAADGVNWVSTDKTLLNDYLHVKKFEGEMAGVEDYVTSNCNGTLLLGQMQVVDLKNSSNYVTMTYTEYTENIDDIRSLLGKEITVFYRQKNSGDEPILVVIDSETTNNKEYTIYHSDIESISNGVIRYYKENSSSAQTLKFNVNEISVRYNGKSVDKAAGTKLRNKNYTSSDNEFTAVYSFEDALKAWLTPGDEHFIYGDIVLTDRGDDGTIDDIQINDYQTIVAIKAPSTTDYKISDKLRTGNYLILNPEDTKYSFTIFKNNKQIKPTGISANDVLLYAESIDKKLYTAYAANSKVSGKITSLNISGGTIDIDNKTYNLGSQCTSYISSKQDGKQLAAGQEVTMYTDKYDTLVWGVVAAEKEIPYAYISNAYEEAGTETCYVTAFLPSVSTAQATNYPLNSKVTVDGESMSAKAVLTKLEATALNSNKDITSGAAPKYSQLVKLELNSDNKVSKIITVSDQTASTNEDDSKIVRCKEIDSYKYSSNNFIKNNQIMFSIKSSTLIIYVPENRSRADFAKKTSSSFTGNKEYTVEAYDINSSKQAGVVLLYGTSGTKTDVSRSTYYSVISKKPVPYYNEADDETTLQFNVFSNSTTETDWISSDSSEFENAEVGDVVLFGYDQNSRALDRQDCILYSDVKNILAGQTATVTATDENGESTTKELSYHWALGATSTTGWVDGWSNTLYDYRFMENGSVYYESYYGRTTAYSRAAVFNVQKVLDSDNSIHVTTSGFDGNELYSDDDFETISLANVKILSVSEDGKTIVPYSGDAADKYTNFQGASDGYGKDCSKIAVLFSALKPNTILIYE